MYKIQYKKKNQKSYSTLRDKYGKILYFKTMTDARAMYNKIRYSFKKILKVVKRKGY